MIARTLLGGSARRTTIANGALYLVVPDESSYVTASTSWSMAA